MSLYRTAARGALVTGASQVFRIGFQLASTVLLARLLAPGDYGVLAMAAVLIGLGELLREVGLSSATVQAREVSDAQQSNLFWFNLALGAVMMVATLWLAPWLARFYGEPAVMPVCRWLSIVFLLNGACAQYRARLNRAMAFGRMSMADVVAQVVGVVVAVGLALRGAGLWALVAQQLVQAAVTLVMMVGQARWLPSWPARSVSIRSFLQYGWGLLGAQLVNYASRNLDAMVIGHRFGGEVLGLYNRAFQLSMAPFSQLSAPSTSVALPLLSRIDDGRAYVDVLVRVQNVFMHAMACLLAVLICWADPGIVWVLGERWSGALPIFRILAVGCMFQVASYACYWAFLSKGLTQRHFVVALITRPAMVALMLVGSLWGVNGVAIGYAAGLAVVWLGALVALRDDAPLVRRMGANAAVVIVTYLLAAAAGTALAEALGAGGVVKVLWSSVGLGGALALQALLNRRFRLALLDSLRSARKMLGKGAVSA